MEKDIDVVSDLYVMVVCLDPRQPRSALASLLPVYKKSSAVVFEDISPDIHIDAMVGPVAFRCVQTARNVFDTTIRTDTSEINVAVQYQPRSAKNRTVSSWPLVTGAVAFLILADVIKRSDLPFRWTIASANVQDMFPSVKGITRPCFRVSEATTKTVRYVRMNSDGFCSVVVSDPRGTKNCLSLVYDPALDKMAIVTHTTRGTHCHPVVFDLRTDKDGRKGTDYPIYCIKKNGLEFTVEYLSGWPNSAYIEIDCNLNGRLPGSSGIAMKLVVNLSNDDDLTPPVPPCKSHCWKCKRVAEDEDEALVRCQVCLRATYCNQACLHGDADDHKHECKQIRDNVRYDIRYGGGDIDDYLKKRKCQYCKVGESTPGQFKQCGGCNEAIYCSRQCCVRDWPKHRDICAHIVNQKRKEEDSIDSDIEARRCQNCNRREPEGGPRFKQCGACRAVIYCSPECQLSDWKWHRAFCDLRVKMKNNE